MVTAFSVVIYFIRRIARRMHKVFKLMHRLHRITLEDAGLSLSTLIALEGGMHLKQAYVINNAICKLFKHHTLQQWNNLPLNIAQCTNFMSFKT